MKAKVQQYFNDNYPEFQAIKFGISGASLLYSYLTGNSRSTIVLPTFICCELPFMAIAANKNVVLVDIDRDTMHISFQNLVAALNEIEVSDAILLIDHSFGYPCAYINEIKEAFPDLHVIEDCVRAAGSMTNSMLVGRLGDAALFSMYKTVQGNDHGAVLIAKHQFDVPAGERKRDSLRSLLSVNPAIRLIYERSRRRRPELCNPSQDDRRNISWLPRNGFPSNRAIRKFYLALTENPEAHSNRRIAYRKLYEFLSENMMCKPIQVADKGEPAYQFLSFYVDNIEKRNKLYIDLHRQGHFLYTTWDQIPAYFLAMREAVHGSWEESKYLAERILHIPLCRYLNEKRQNHLIAESSRSLVG